MIEQCTKRREFTIAQKHSCIDHHIGFLRSSSAFRKHQHSRFLNFGLITRGHLPWTRGWIATWFVQIEISMLTFRKCRRDQYCNVQSNYVKWMLSISFCRNRKRYMNNSARIKMCRDFSRFVF